MYKGQGRMPVTSEAILVAFFLSQDFSPKGRFVVATVL